MNLRNVVLIALAGLLWAGCGTTITNLTPRQQPRTPDNLYPFEVAFDTDQGTVQKATLKPFVMIGTDLYPMQPVEKIQNRWEALVPIPRGTNLVYYRYKFDYRYNRIPTVSESSRLSPTYQMELVGR